MAMQTAAAAYKCVLLGDEGVGKTSLIYRHILGQVPQVQSCLASCDCHVTMMNVNEEKVQLTMWDTEGSRDYDRLRPLAYPHTDVFLLCFSVDEPMSLKNVKERWYPELNHHCPETPILLVGTKEDLRDDNRREPLKASPLVSAEEGLKTAKDIGARGYAECSALSGRGVAEVLTKVAPLAKRTPPTATTTHNRGEGRKCTIL